MSCKTCAWGGCPKTGKDLPQCNKYAPSLEERTRQLNAMLKDRNRDSGLNPIHVDVYR